MFDIEGKVALITGGASGLGLAYAEELLRNGLKGVAIADINEELGHKALDDIIKEFGANRAIFLKTDVTDRVQFDDAFKKTILAFQNVDILINNAGILNDATWEREIAININGTIHGTLLALDNYIPNHRSGSEGVIVNISSTVGLDVFGCFPIYTGTKHAILGLSRAFGTQPHYDRTKVKVLTLCPGATDTSLIDFNPDQVKTLGPNYTQLIKPEIGSLYIQTPNFVAKAIVDVIEKGESGSIWAIHGDEPAYEIYIPKGQYRRKE